MGRKIGECCSYGLAGQDLKEREAVMDNEALGIDLESRSWVAVMCTRTMVILNGICPVLNYINARLKRQLHYKSWPDQYI